MLSSEKIVVSVRNHKKDNFNQVTNYVHFYVRHFEYEKVHDAISEMLDKIESAHAGTDPMTISDDDVRKILSEVDKTENTKYTPEEIENFISDRAELRNISKEMNSWGVTWGQFNDLPDVDRVFIELQAHTAIPAITLDADLVGKINISNIVESYYRDGKLKDTKDMLRAMFGKLVGKEGELFYGIKLKKSNFDDDVVRSFLAEFRGKARRTVKTKNQVKEYGNYVYSHMEKSTKKQISALTDFFAVMLDRKTDYTVIKPEKAEAETVKAA